MLQCKLAEKKAWSNVDLVNLMWAYSKFCWLAFPNTLLESLREFQISVDNTCALESEVNNFGGCLTGVGNRREGVAPSLSTLEAKRETTRKIRGTPQIRWCIDYIAVTGDRGNDLRQDRLSFVQTSSRSRLSEHIQHVSSILRSLYQARRTPHVSSVPVKFWSNALELWEKVITSNMIATGSISKSIIKDLFREICTIFYGLRFFGFNTVRIPLLFLRQCPDLECSHITALAETLVLFCVEDESISYQNGENRRYPVFEPVRNITWSSVPMLTS